MKTSGFGVGEAGRNPETTPLDDLAAAQIMAAESGHVSESYELTVYRGDKQVAVFPASNLHELVELACEKAAEYPDTFGQLSATTWEVGSYHKNGDGIQTVYWREKVPGVVVVCDECGHRLSENEAVCPVCGEVDMLSTRGHTWVYHQEVVG